MLDYGAGELSLAPFLICVQATHIMIAIPHWFSEKGV